MYTLEGSTWTTALPQAARNRTGPGNGFESARRDSSAARRTCPRASPVRTTEQQENDEEEGGEGVGAGEGEEGRGAEGIRGEGRGMEGRMGGHNIQSMTPQRISKQAYTTNDELICTDTKRLLTQNMIYANNRIRRCIAPIKEAMPLAQFMTNVVD